ncbi:hypothetical protein E5288_WYG014210 [Bos mutus]|uniref:Eukaryotic translation initiation factor 4E-binding protein 1 n=1 Tax=Bos mutus TaxID=72004 RepID=A0A6B0R8L1_9CETA|nr:hypothetical protein [Bos mutus]
MSGGSSCSQTPSRAIPTTRRVVLADGVQLPPGDYSTTPGGTLFSTTPGGTRIIYDRKFLMECRNSPVTKTPPRDLPTIPGVTSPTGDEPPTEARQNHLRSSPEDKPAGGEPVMEFSSSLDAQVIFKYSLNFSPFQFLPSPNFDTEFFIFPVLLLSQLQEHSASDFFRLETPSTSPPRRRWGSGIQSRRPSADVTNLLKVADQEDNLR